MDYYGRCGRCPPDQAEKSGGYVDPCEAEEGDNTTYILIGNRCVSAENISAEEAESLHQVLWEYHGCDAYDGVLTDVGGFVCEGRWEPNR